MATWGMLSFQDSVSPLMEQLMFFHDHSMVVLVMITVLVFYFVSGILTNTFLNRFIVEGQEIEIFWTFIPAVLLIFIAFPSLRVLYLVEEVHCPDLTLSTVGHQWYWSYEYSDFIDIEFDSFMLPFEEGGFRLLDVDNRTVLPWGVFTRILITSSDVIHSWACMGLGVSMDAVPGRVNQVCFLINRPGLYYGQCSEICGANHSFMPIVIESVSVDAFLGWVSAFY
uniref:Cytochrome c oxidase subunit 2 n=1 Tax=Centruroides limpidus TaxID=6876 RepID=Q5G7A2_CENLI|nr:cytochrome c oxidase subunit II [Centruroides limpidus]AAV53584.1 cytochrome c oxidase subunit II [Centruroides limpidus]